ncbi:accessory gland-specific peptide 70A-like [Drosophila sulfurigaster albostrigata]|uniref:accessory gland-specific peptide 70A-like n=1 Tax=Drosophila sulfurigaster albostrigata TaxID=89887 RepID=UPI002D21845E|nr:accessory gland-specific peptide 70A-like [Drosophila sulfurigaster albostrigata]
MKIYWALVLTLLGVLSFVNGQQRTTTKPRPRPSTTPFPNRGGTWCKLNSGPFWGGKVC